MKIFYATTKSYPATTADHIYIRELLRGFSASGEDATLVVAKNGDDLSGLKVAEIPKGKIKTFAFLLWLINFCRKDKQKDTVFLANDFNILVVLSVWRFWAKCRYKICADLHMLSDTWKDGVALRSADIIITTSDRLRNVVGSKFLKTKEKSFTVHGGVDLELAERTKGISKQTLRKELGLPEGILAGYVGLWKTMGKDKGLRTMIEAAAQISSLERMVFVGGTPEEIIEYESFAKEKGVAKKCLFIARQPYEKVLSYERALDVLVISYPDEPHFADYGFPMKVYEYLASGSKIVYSNLPIMDEVLHEVGLAFNPGDFRSLATAIENTLLREDCLFDVGSYSWKAKASKIRALLGKIS